MTGRGLRIFVEGERRLAAVDAVPLVDAAATFVDHLIHVRVTTVTPRRPPSNPRAEATTGGKDASVPYHRRRCRCRSHGNAVAAPQGYRFEVVQVQPAGPGASDVSVRLVNVRDGKPVRGAVVSESAVDMTPSGMKEMKGNVTPADTDGSGIYHFRTRTNMADNWALHLSATVPGESRTERTYIPTAKVTYTRTVRGEPALVRGTVTFGAR